IILALLVIYLFFLIRHEQTYPFLLWFSTGLLSINLFVYPVAFYIAKGWMRFGKALGYVNSKVLLSVIYVIILTPIALLKKRKKHTGDTNWQKSLNKPVN